MVRYSPGALDRASHLQTRFALLAEDFGRWADRAMPLNAVLLSRTDWAAFKLQVPYGLPAKLATGEIALSAWADADTVGLWKNLVGSSLPELEGYPLYGTKEEAGSLLLTDLLAQSVAARVLLERAGYGAVDPHVLSLATHVLALGVSHRHERLSVPEIRKIYYGPATAAEKSEWTARLIAESRYFRAAEAIVNRRGSASAPKTMLKLLKRGNGPTVLELVKKFPELQGLFPPV